MYKLPNSSSAEILESGVFIAKSIPIGLSGCDSLVVCMYTSAAAVDERRWST